MSYKNIEINNFLEYGFLFESKEMSGERINLLSYEQIFGGNAKIYLSKELNLRISYDKSKDGTLMLNSITLNQKMNDSSSINISNSVNINQSGISSLNYNFSNFCSTGTKMTSLAINTMNPLIFNYSDKKGNLYYGLDYGEEIDDIYYGNTTKGLGLFGKKTRRAFHSDLCYVKDNSGDKYVKKISLNSNCFLNYPSIKMSNRITNKGKESLEKYLLTNRYIFSHGLEIVRYNRDKDLCRIILNTSVENKLCNCTFVYQKKIREDNVGVYLIFPDTLIKDYGDIKKDDTKPKIIGVNYCAKIFGFNIPMFCEKKINLTDEGIYFGFLPKLLFSLDSKLKV